MIAAIVCTGVPIHGRVTGMDNLELLTLEQSFDMIKLHDETRVMVDTIRVRQLLVDV